MCQAGGIFTGMIVITKKVNQKWLSIKTIFLREKLVPLFNDRYLIHCSTYLKTFPIEKTNEYFVGGWWDENNFGKPQNYIFF